MKQLKLFFALFAMLALNVGNAWGEKITDYSKIGTGKTYYIGATTGGTDYYLSVNGASTSTSIAGTAVTDKTKAATFVFTGSGTSWSIKFADYANYLGLKNGKDNGKVQVVSSAATFTASNQSGKLRLSIGSYSIQKNNSGTQFGSYGNTQTDIWLEEVPGSSEPATQYTIKWHTAKGVTTDVTLNEGATITKPETDPTMSGYVFMGWTASCNVASDGSDFTALTDFGTADSDKDFYAVFAVATTTGGGESTPTEVTDLLDRTLTGATSTTYVSWSGKKATSSAVYAGNSAGGNSSIQLRSNSSNSGIVTTASGGKAKKVVVVWQSSTTDGRTIDIYGKNSAYSAATDLYNATNQGTKLGSIKKGTTTELTISGDYEYIGIRSNSGALYLTSVSITWASEGTGGSTTTYSDYITTCASDIEFVELGDAFKWSATEAEVTIDATDNVFPELTNTHNVPVTYSSTDDAIASIAADGTVTLKKEGTVTITAKYAGGTSAGTDKEYKAKTVTYSLKVNKAVAQPTGTMYVKVTDAVTDGEYLIVYEAGNVAFDGSLATLDVAGNMIEAQISSNTIAGNTEIDAATFTIASMEGGHSIQSKSGTYIGRTASGNGMNTGSSAILNIISITNGAVKVAGSGSGASASLQYFAQSGSERFRYYTSAQKAIALYKKVDPNAVVEPVFTPAAGEYYGTQSVTISCATAGAEVYYTLDGTDPTSTSTKYTGAISITATTTVKAIAVKGANSSEVVSATYTILAPLATMQAIFDKATDATQSVHIKFNDWVISGVVPGKDGKPSSNAYITDGSKGFIIYTKDGHGFNVGDKLRGTVVCDLTRYNGSAEVVGLTSLTTDLSVTTGGVVTPVEVADKSTLSGVNTGAVIKITGVCETKNVNSKDYFYVGGIQLFNSLFAYDTPTIGGKYNVTGVYLQYNDIPEILPRSVDDIEEINDLTTATIAIADMIMEIGDSKTIEATITPDAAKTTVQYAITSGREYITLDGTTITAVAAGTATITATIAEVADEYYGTTKTFNVTVKPQNIAVLPFTFDGGRDNIETTLGMSQDGLGTDYTTAGVTTNLKFDGTGDWVIIHFNGQADKLAYDIKGNGFSGGEFTVQQSADGSAYTEVVTHTELGEAATKEHVLAAESRYVKFIYTTKSSGNVGLGNIKITKFGEEPVDPEVPEEPTLSKAVYQKVTSEPADWSGEYILVYEQEGEPDCYVWNGQDENNGCIAATCNNDIISGAFATIIIAPMTDGYSVRVNGGGKSGMYIGGVSGSNTISYSAEAILNTIEFSEVGIDLTSNTSVMRFNAASNTLRFRYYKSGQSAVQLYKKLVYTRSVTSGNFGTICLPYGSSNYSGAEFFEVAGKETGKVTLNSVKTLVAGTPYIFQATDSKISVVYEGEASEKALDDNGLYGTFDKINDVKATSNGKGYIIALMANGTCALQLCGDNCWLDPNRAYLVIEEINKTKSPMPGCRRISMDVQGENEATGVEDLFTTDAPVKVIENGQLIIIRDGVKYNIQGQKL